MRFSWTQLLSFGLILHNWHFKGVNITYHFPPFSLIKLEGEGEEEENEADEEEGEREGKPKFIPC